MIDRDFQDPEESISEPPADEPTPMSEVLQCLQSMYSPSTIILTEIPLVAAIETGPPNTANAPKLLKVFKAMPANVFFSGQPSKEMISWIKCIENADPHNPNLNKDNKYGQWGHQQFNRGDLTVSKVLTSWEVVGSTATACWLLTTVLKTSRIAQEVTAAANQPQGSFLADTYVNIISSKLFHFWESSGPKVSKWSRFFFFCSNEVG